MTFHGLFANEQAAGDLTVAETLTKQPNNHSLAHAQHFGCIPALHDGLHNRRKPVTVEPNLTVVHLVNGLQQECRFARLRYISGSAHSVIEDETVRFEIITQAAERAGVKISSRLLRIARIVAELP